MRDSASRLSVLGCPMRCVGVSLAIEGSALINDRYATFNRRQRLEVWETKPTLGGMGDFVLLQGSVGDSRAKLFFAFGIVIVSGSVVCGAFVRADFILGTIVVVFHCFKMVWVINPASRC